LLLAWAGALGFALLVMAAGLAAVFTAGWAMGRGDSDETSTSADPDPQEETAGTAEASPDQPPSEPPQSEGEEADAPAAPSFIPTIFDGEAPAGGYLDAKLDVEAEPGAGLFVLSGRLPESPESAALLMVLDVAYSPFAEIDVTMDPELAPGPWMASAQRIIPLLGSITSGAVRIHSEGVVIEGIGSGPEVEVFAGAANSLAGDLPVDTSKLASVDLREPSYEGIVADGTISMLGEVPEQAVADRLAEAAAANYGAENVTNQLTVTPEVHAAFWMHTVPGGIETLSAYPAYRFVIRDGGVSADLQSDFTFARDSAELTEQATGILGLWYAVLIRAPAATLTIRGHTDGDGEEAYNQTLSEARARAYVDALLGLGIAPERLVAEGLGETDPVAPNDTPENKARNRRVEFVFG
jgi:outer membrane protein OmpA-like peptidoglycan-associated protein